MVSKILLKSFIILLIASYTPKTQAQAQNQVHEVDLLGLQSIQFSTINDEIYFYDGLINLKNNEILEGSISLNHIKDGKYSVILRTKDSCTYISNEDIEDVVLLEKNKHNVSQTRFVLLENHQKLLRELYFKDSENAIYDAMEKPFDGSVMNDVYVKENGSLIRLFDFWTSGPKKALINYINKRDNKKYKRRDFKSLEQLFATL